MFQFIFKRIVQLIPILFIVSIITFSLSSFSAGDAARVLAEREYIRPNTKEIELVRVKYGLDKPLPVQYCNWLKKVFKGDFGNSYKNNKPVLGEMIYYFPNTVKLSLGAIIIVICISIPVGIISALKPNSIFDYVGRFFSFFSASVPSFWVGLILLYVLGAKLKFISVLGGRNQGILIPAFTMAFGMCGANIRLMKASITEVLNKGYMQAAKAKGISCIRLYCKHGLKNAILPILTKTGIMFSGFLCGASIIESIFSISGIGKYALDAVITKDVPVIQGYVMLMAVIVVVINLAVDILYSLIDPRIKVQ
ncbi:peptide/nickel transport system permease protein [Lachnotalea glycerini]|uniref:ABC transporter permease n=1 Tax=Lachnotalea glycerini TaxID=1763509 RepID=A0A255ICG8_9FIRM|nr:ABC transporter permease [Lachnotalea glycerini]PXV85721.1 peptide/nickel transport system permease protein [Lachnotalea glycerini]RDY30708.1 ABC transporter permease [Lachnotalea glycerini]